MLYATEQRGVLAITHRVCGWALGCRDILSSSTQLARLDRERKVTTELMFDYVHFDGGRYIALPHKVRFGLQQHKSAHTTNIGKLCWSSCRSSFQSHRYKY